MIKRITVNSGWSGENLLSELQKSTAKTLPYFDDLKLNRGWMTLWGKMYMDNSNIILTPDPGETGATILLDGTRLWENYSVKAIVTSKNQGSVYVWTRFQDDNNNIACNFGNGFVHIDQTLQGIKNVIQGVNNPQLGIPSGEFTVEARVKGRNVSCFLNGINIVQTFFADPSLDKGGIGFKTWEKNPNLTELTIKQLEVKPL